MQPLAAKRLRAAAWAVTVVFAGRAMSAQTLRPTEIFDLSATLPMSPMARAEAIQLGPSGIRAVFAGTLPGRTVIRASTTGAVLDSAPLPREGLPAVLGENGDVYLLRPNRDNTALLSVHSATGEPTAQHRLENVKRTVAVGGVLYALRGDGALLTIPATTDAGEVAPSAAVTVNGLSNFCLLLCHLVAIDNRTLAIVDSHEPAVTFVDLQSGAVRRVVVRSEVVTETFGRLLAIPSAAPPSTARPYLFSAASPGNGNLYLAVSAFKVTDGMPLVEIGKDGTEIRSFRLLSVPANAHRSGVLNGLAMPHRVAVFGSTIAAVTGSGVVSVYEMEE